jgi:hypothetical protein
MKEADKIPFFHKKFTSFRPFLRLTLAIPTPFREALPYPIPNPAHHVPVSHKVDVVSDSSPTFYFGSVS